MGRSRLSTTHLVARHPTSHQISKCRRRTACIEQGRLWQGPADIAGAMNRSLVMASCRADGVLLKPDRPALATDQSFADGFYGATSPPPLSLLLSHSSTASILVQRLLVALQVPAASPPTTSGLPRQSSAAGSAATTSLR